MGKEIIAIVIPILTYIIITIPYWVIEGFTIFHILYIPFASILCILLGKLLVDKLVLSEMKND